MNLERLFVSFLVVLREYKCGRFECNVFDELWSDWCVAQICQTYSVPESDQKLFQVNFIYIRIITNFDLIF